MENANIVTGRTGMERNGLETIWSVARIINMNEKDKIIVTPKSKPDSIRSWIAYRLVDLANWIRPGNEAAIAYMTGLLSECMYEQMLYGRSEIEIKVKKHKKSKLITKYFPDSDDFLSPSLLESIKKP